VDGILKFDEDSRLSLELFAVKENVYAFDKGNNSSGKRYDYVIALNFAYSQKLPTQE
jgi:hypothetical protein